MERFDLEQFCKVRAELTSIFTLLFVSVQKLMKCSPQQLMQDRRATLARIVPAIAKALAEDPIVRKYRYDALEYFTSGGAPVPVSDNILSR
jgi:hypothetical protein